MIEVPDFTKSFEFETLFYLTSDTQRIGKLIAHYELFKMVQDVQGDIVECGVFKGSSFVRFATFRKLLGDKYHRRIFGFDTFAEFPETSYDPDKQLRKNFIEDSGGESIDIEQLRCILKFKNCDENVELIKGNITKTIPEFMNSHPDLKIALLNVDVDVYEPSVTILEYLYPRLQTGGVLMLDDYGVFPGETKAVNDYFQNKKTKIQRFPFSSTPSYLIKE